MSSPDDYICSRCLNLIVYKKSKKEGVKEAVINSVLLQNSGLRRGAAEARLHSLHFLWQTDVFCQTFF